MGGTTYRDDKGRKRPLHPNVIMPHPFLRDARFLLQSGPRERFLYRFLRATREPTNSRPTSGRVLVENVGTGERQEFYSTLFGINWSK